MKLFSNRRGRMQTHLQLIVAVSLCLILGIGPSLTLASNQQLARLTGPARTIAARSKSSGFLNTGKRNESGPRNPASEKFRQNTEQSHSGNVQPPASLPGQSATLLPDGRWLMIGGEESD